jgi:hypothetical protein
VLYIVMAGETDHHQVLSSQIVLTRFPLLLREEISDLQRKEMFHENRRTHPSFLASLSNISLENMPFSSSA